GGRLDTRYDALHVNPVSIRAPARGATQRRPDAQPCADGFYPRPRTGGDEQGRAVHVLAPQVSIRAPARGATSRAAPDVRPFMFLSAPPHGGRLPRAIPSRHG